MKVTTEGMLVAAVFCMFAFEFYIADKVDQFWGEIHECKRQYEEEEIIIFNGKEGNRKKSFDHNTVA